MDTIFTKIINKEIPAHIVYEDQHTLAFLDIHPLSLGHLLLIPKEPARTLDELSDDAAAALGRVLPRLCRALKTVNGGQAYNVLQNNGRGAHQEIQQVHFHIIPKPDSEQGLQITWRPRALNPEVGKELAERLAQLCAA